MAKNAPVKKPKRRLKRSVRRSLSAVLMITAIGVAAIPVPENYAVNDDIALYADGSSGDAHADAVAQKFIYEPDVPTTDENYNKNTQKNDEKHGYANLVLDKYANVSDTDLVAKLPQTNADGTRNPNYDPDLSVSFSVLNLGNDASGEEIYNLSWQFAFYLSTNPRGGGTSGVICKYNSEYYSPTVSLPLLPYTEYFVVTQNDMDQYFAAGSGGAIANPSSDRLKNGTGNSRNGMDGTDPNDAVTYTYANYKANLTPASFLTDYFEEELNDWKKGCDDYDARKATAESNGTTFEEDVPAPFVKTPSLTPNRGGNGGLTSTQRRQYFAEHCNALSSAGPGWQLYGVQDGRPNSKGGTIFLARGGSLEANSPCFVGDYGFLAMERSLYSMCAIGVRAFAKVNNVVNMEVPDQIGYIGDEAFMEASLLQSVKLNNVTFIGNRAFKGCTNLTSADLGSATETIGQECFAGATGLQGISFGTAVSTIGYGAFYNCSSMTSIAFAEKGQPCTVKDYAFYNCAALTSVSMENANIIQLGDGVFATSTGAQPMSFVLPKTLGAENNGIAQNDVIGDFLFAGRASLQYVIFPQEYGRSREAKIPDNIFHGCIALQYVEFPCNPQNDPTACGFVRYTPGKLFADVQNPDLYVKGPKTNSSGADAYPRTSTWDAVSAVSSTVPYLYIENGVEYYEVSDGYYLICINDQGIMTSCTFKSQNSSDWENWLKSPNWAWGKDVAGDAEAGEDGAVYKNWGGEGGKLVIPAMVGETRVVGIASDCFKDTQLNRRVRELVIEDNSISSIADGVFQGGGGSANNDWQALEKVYIGNSVDSIGNNAFKDCISLIDVTFSSPSGGYEAFTIGTDAFNTQSPQLTFHGDIVEGYKPFEWATDPENVINADKGLRVCYKSLAPTYLTVMYNPVTDMVTLLDYPKYDEISSILNEAHQDDWEGRYNSYEDMRVQQLYAQFAVSDYDGRRTDFANKWQEYLDNGEDPTQLYSDSVYYGPWVNPDFCKGDSEKGWKKYLSAASVPDEEEEDEDLSGKVTDFFFKPIIAYAAGDDPDPYYTTYKFDVALIVGANDPYRTPSEEERALVLSTRDIVIPAGVDSIDVYGYRYNLTEDGTPTNNGENSENYSTYLLRSWDSKSANMYLGSSDPDEDGIRAVPGLFSGYYEDGVAAPSETRKRGNDLITSVTMSTVKYLPDNAFDSCEGLNWVIIGSELEDIGKAPFRGCYSLTNVNCSGNEKYSFDNGIIYSNNSDSSLMIEECLAARGNLVGQVQISADTDSSLLSVSTIREGAFEDCDYINEVNFGQNNTAGLTVIPEDCFKNCDSLQRVTLPKTVNDVKQGAFVNITGLTDLYVYGKEVQISAKAFDGERDSDGNLDKRWTSVHAYEDSAVVRYVGQYGTEYKLQLSNDWLGEVWQVSFYDQNYELIEDMKDLDGEPLRNPQDVPNGERPTTPQNPPNTDDWTFERWVGMNNVKLGDRIYDNTAFYAQGYSTSGLVNGKYPVSFWDGVDGTQVGPMQYIDPGSSAIPPAHPSHEGYEPDGYSEDYTNVQSPMTIIMLYKPTGSGSGTGTGTGTGSGGSTQNSSNKSSSNKSSNTSSGASTTSASSDSTSTLSGMYTVTVINGSGSGNYAPGTTVLIQANTPAAGSVFSKWTTESQGVSLASVSTTPTTFTMPSNNVTITAEFTAGTATTGGSGSTAVRDTGNGSTRVDITKPGISNKDLATATVNGSTDNFVVKITETDEATRAVQEALTNKYGSLENILYYAMDISLYDATGTVKITNTAGLSVDITIPIPDALVAYGGNNMAGAVVNSNQLENLSESFTTINGVPCIRFTATHFSPYTIYVDTGNLTEGMLDITPKTGDPIHPKWFLSIGLACLSIILFMKKDKAVKVKTA